MSGGIVMKRKIKKMIGKRMMSNGEERIGEDDE